MMSAAWCCSAPLLPVLDMSTHLLVGSILASCGTIVAELRNNLSNHMLPIEPGMRLLQLVLIRMTLPAANPYSSKGNYQNQTGATGSNYNFSRLAS